MKRRVAHITSVHSRTDARIFQKECAYFEKRNFEVFLLVADSKADEELNNIKIVNVSSKPMNRIYRIFVTTKKLYLKALELNCDLYLIHDPELIPIGLKLKTNGKKVIFDSHEDFPRQILEKDWIPFFFRKILSNAADAYYGKSLKKFDAVFTVAPHFVDILRKSSDHVYMITNYPLIEGELTQYTYEDYCLRQNNLCYTGSVYKNSLQENILTAIEGIQKLNYYVVGDLNRKLKKRLSKFSSYEKVIFIDKVPKKELVKIYEKVSIGIVIFDYSPNVGYKKGTLGNNKIFEYMQYSLPIICTDFELWKAIVDKYKCGIYVNPHNIIGIKSAIKYLMENKQEAYQMGQNGKRAVLEEYNWATQESIMDSVVARVFPI